MSTTMEASGMTVATEVVAKAQWRRFTVEEKLRVLAEAFAGNPERFPHERPVPKAGAIASSARLC